MCLRHLFSSETNERETSRVVPKSVKRNIFRLWQKEDRKDDNKHRPSPVYVQLCIIPFQAAYLVEYVEVLVL